MLALLDAQIRVKSRLEFSEKPYTTTRPAATPAHWRASLSWKSATRKDIRPRRRPTYRGRTVYIAQGGPTLRRPGATASATLTEEHIQRLNEIWNATVVASSVVSISKANSEVWEKLRVRQQLTVELWRHRVSARPLKQVDRFGWDDRTEAAQVNAYAAHIESIITKPRDIVWMRGSQYSNLLKTDKEVSKAYHFRGTSDFIAVDRLALRSRFPIKGLRVLMQLKKEVQPGSVYQALVQLCLANLHSPDTQPVVVLTDLCEDWNFYWMDGKRVWSYVEDDRRQAVALIEGILEGFSLSDFSAPDASSPAIERLNEEAKRIIKRRRFTPCMDPVHESPAPLEDLRDVLPEHEYKAMMEEAMLQQLLRIPCVRALANSDPPPMMHT